MDRLFFELMQVGMGQLDCLSRGPSPEEWQELYALAKREKVLGICYNGIVRLMDFGLRAPQELQEQVLDWMAESEELKERSALADKRCRSLQKKLDERGFRYTLLPGHGALPYYGDELAEFRDSDGIDLYVRGGKERVSKFIKQTGQDTITGDGSMLYLTAWADTEIRLYHRAKAGKQEGRSDKLTTWLKHNGEFLFCTEGEFTLPSPSLNIVLTLFSIYNRFIAGQLYMREFMDLYFILKKTDGRFIPFNGGQTIDGVMRQMQLSRFTGGVMWLMQEVFGVDAQWLPCSPHESEGKFILTEVLHEHRFLSRWKHLLLHYHWRDLF